MFVVWTFFGDYSKQYLQIENPQLFNWVKEIEKATQFNEKEVTMFLHLYAEQYNLTWEKLPCP